MNWLRNMENCQKLENCLSQENQKAKNRLSQENQEAKKYLSLKIWLSQEKVVKKWKFNKF